MIITNAPTIEGYNIIEYLGNCTGASKQGVAGLFGEGVIGGAFNKNFSRAYSEAVSYMEQNAPLKANAIISVEMVLTYIDHFGDLVIGVSGTAVRIEKNALTAEERVVIEEEEKNKKQQLEEYEQLRRKTGMDKIRAEYDKVKDERVIAFLYEICDAKRFSEILECWKRAGLEGVPEYTKVEQAIIKYERIESYKKNPDHTAFIVNRARIRGLFQK